MGFFAITVVMVMDVHEYPVFATSGLQLLFFLLAGGLLWFVPVALCSAEMATVEGFQEGGIFGWVKNTLGERWGFAAIFFQWFQVTVGFVTMLYFIVGSVASVFDVPAITQNPALQFVCIMAIFWGLTFSQLGGTGKTVFFGKIGLVVGILILAAVLCVMTALYIADGGALQLTVTPSAFIPDFSKPSTLVVFVSFILSYAGIEASATYVNELKNPQKQYPKVIFLVVLAAIVLNAVGGLSVAVAVPPKELSLSGGIIQALQTLFTHFNTNLGWLAGVVALMVAVGVIGEITGWIVGPARGLHAAARQGLLPPVFRKVNKNGVPLPLVILQGFVVTAWGAFLTFAGGGNNLSYIAAISLTVVIYLAAYILLFIGYFVLVNKKDSLRRAYQVSGGKTGKRVVAGIGLVISVFALIISFVPPSIVPEGDAPAYRLILITGFVAVLAMPFILYACHDKSVHKTLHDPVHMRSADVNPYIDPIARGEHILVPDEEDLQ